FKPVMKLIRSDRPRILIADEVGVGKTIEAGLILRELQARSDISSVLIICPRPLVTENKWRNEMKRFDEEFVHMDGASLRNCIDETDKEGSWYSRFNKAILPFSLFNEELLHGVQVKGKKRVGLLDLDPTPHFDLVIVDEAHHLRNPDTWLYRGVEYFCANADAVVFLTATPVQLATNDLFVLLNLLRPDLIRDQAVFQQMSEPNPLINRCIELARGGAAEWQLEAIDHLSAVGQTSWGSAILCRNPDFQRLYDLLGDHVLDTEERVAFVRDAERLHTFASIINRTRRRDIGTFFITRKPETVEIPFSPSQQQLHDGLLEIQAKILGQIHGDRNLLFLMTTIRRQAASCLYGLAPFLNEILTRKIDLLELDEIDEGVGEGELTVGTIQDRILEILVKAEQLDSNDPKLEALQQIIRDKEQLPNNKILLFSSFRHTLAYLLKHLQAANLRVGYIHGGTPDDERRSQRNRFELSRNHEDALDILLSSEVGCEGLDYQFCDCMVNYDLPWNPMRIEQRIGRIDRYGQKSDSVAIYNLITPGTVDADIYYRCLARIGVFRATIGGNEEIIGNLTSKIKAVAENLTLTPEERQARLQQVADNEIRIIQEQAELEEKQADLFGLRLPNKNDEDIKSAESFWLSPSALQQLLEKYLEKVAGGQQEHILGDKPLKTLRLSQEMRDALLADFRKLTYKVSPLYREWEKWLKGSNQHFPLTFEAACATEHRDAAFITPIHPLAIQAGRAIAPEQKLCTMFRVMDTTITPGKYPFAVYQWQK
ncbi:MAG: helicase-related protein, partial [Deltaproteobacteria bacterium]